MLVTKGIYRKRNTTGGRTEHLQEIRNEWARLTMLTYEETDDAIRFAHEGGTQWASADNKKKNKLHQLNSEC